MPPSIAIATCEGHPHAADADAPFIAALTSRGIHTRRLAWSDPHAPWHTFTACVIRSTWDWHERPAEFRAWMDRVEPLTTLINPAPTLRWSLDKRYLADLESAGIRCVPTRYLDIPNAALAPQLIRQAASDAGWPRIVIKPSLGATAYRTALITADADLETWAAANPDFTGTLLLQPFLNSITSHGEFSLTFFNHHFSHAARKLPKPGDFRVQSDFGGTLHPATCPPQELALAERCLRALPAPALYARVDIARSADNQPMLMELELVEPDLFLDVHPPSAAAFADAVINSLR